MSRFSRMRARVDLQAFEHEPGLPERARRAGRTPPATRSIRSPTDRSSARGRRCTHRAARPRAGAPSRPPHGCSTTRSGLRFCGIVLLDPRPCANGSYTSPTSVCIISFTSIAILPSVPPTSAEEASDLGDRVAHRVPGDGGLAEPELGHQAGLRLQRALLDRGERAACAAELADQDARAQLREARRDAARSRRGSSPSCSRR